jgi:hypothetical protein
MLIYILLITVLSFLGKLWLNPYFLIGNKFFCGVDNTVALARIPVFWLAFLVAFAVALLPQFAYE